MKVYPLAPSKKIMVVVVYNFKWTICMIVSSGNDYAV